MLLWCEQACASLSVMDSCVLLHLSVTGVCVFTSLRYKKHVWVKKNQSRKADLLLFLSYV